MTGKQSWRLRKTLARRIEIRPIEDADIGYAWAAYKTGGLSEMGFAQSLTADKFKIAFEHSVITQYPATWVVMAQTSKGFIPVAFVFGAWAPLGAYLIVMGISWFSWASKRNILEGTVGFFNSIRKELSVMGYANEKHKKLYEVCCMHGIMRRIGTSHVALPDGPAAVFEGRK